MKTRKKYSKASPDWAVYSSILNAIWNDFNELGVLPHSRILFACLTVSFLVARDIKDNGDRRKLYAISNYLIKLAKKNYDLEIQHGEG